MFFASVSILQRDLNQIPFKSYNQNTCFADLQRLNLASTKFVAADTFFRTIFKIHYVIYWKYWKFSGILIEYFWMLIRILISKKNQSCSKTQKRLISDFCTSLIKSYVAPLKLITVIFDFDQR
ncbi:hypothetical protein BpHYR1_010118 [Brachionus plicatilis]|uniref:Uncharacterized protein n=1 Tax=Brachionus plicatilis TaxID=10195 RepID=A0A3M7PQM3_BRAPC|nr:hypothetical protein BpHYR1_010118 [Brachionus plicatilis]